MARLADTAVERLLDRLLEDLHAVLGDKLVGLYLYGSLVWGDFDPRISDLDLLATLAADLDDAALERLRALHAALAQEFPAWEDRIEVQYLAHDVLRAFKRRTARMGVISPGEPLHFVEANAAWLSNWYSIRERGIALYGPPPATFIEPITTAEFLQAVRAYAEEWRTEIGRARDSRPSQSYAILTLCRAYCSLMLGRQVSKIEGARWAMAAMPQYAGLIEDALRWRAEARQPVADPEATYGEAERFVHAVSDRIAAEGL